MKLIDAKGMDYKSLNAEVRSHKGDVNITNCLGQRFIGDGLAEKHISIMGTPGNALGAYLNGAEITVFGNAQDAVGDTMNKGRIIIHGHTGDAVGYAMRGGKILVRDNAGYRAGIHMKAYEDNIPVMVIGGTAGSFLGEYQAGGIIIILGMNRDEDKEIVSNFPCTGMHGGMLLLRDECKHINFPSHLTVERATKEDLEQIRPHIEEFANEFEMNADELLDCYFTKVTPNSANPYKQMYVKN